MGKAKQPVTVNGIEFDALLDEERTLEADTPDYPVEGGFMVSDTIILKPLMLSMTLYLSDTPVTWRNRGHGGTGWVEGVLQRLENLYFSKETVTVATSEQTYRNMAIQNISILKSTEAGYARKIPVAFKEVRVTESRRTTIPAGYGRSGASGANAGTASTSTGSAPAGSGASSASVLFSLANSAGLLR